MCIPTLPHSAHSHSLSLATKANPLRPRELARDLAELDLPVDRLLVQVEEEEGAGLARDVPRHLVVVVPGRGVANVWKEIQR